MKGERAAPFDRACVVAADEQVFVSPAWSLRVLNEAGTAGEERAESASGIEAEKKPELFVKPDDWVEVNNVADRCPEIVERMQTAMAEFIQACEAKTPAVLAPLPDELVHLE